MAPIIGLKRAQLIELLRKPQIAKTLPIQINWMGPAGIVQVEDGTWRLRSLACNEGLAERERLARLAVGDDVWAPEETWPFYEPAEVLVEAADAEAFIIAIQGMDWPFTPDDFDNTEDSSGALSGATSLLKKPRF
jgi:hypothetical protein